MSWIVFILLAVAAASMREVAEKNVLAHEKPLDFLVLRGLFFLVFSLFLIPWANFDLNLSIIGLIVLAGAIASLAIYYKRTALKNMDISIVEPLTNFAPIFTLVIAFIFLNETVTLLELAGILLIVVGTYVLETSPSQTSFLEPLKKITKSKYTLMAIGSTVLFSALNVIDRAAVSRHTDIFTYFILMWLVAHLILAVVRFAKHGFKGLKETLKKDRKGVFLCSFFDLASTLLLYQSLSLAATALVIAVFRLQSLFATIFGGKFFHEKHLAKHSTACVVMTIGAVLVVL